MAVRTSIDREHAEIGDRLRQVREAFSALTQKDWASKNGFNADQYNSWERGVRRIPVEAAESLSDDFGLTLDWIYRGRRDGLSAAASDKL
jgi:transcriptional regulator with XRE-family HTH domain